MIDIDSPPLPKKKGSISYAQFSGGGGLQTRSVMGDVHEHIFPSTLFTDEGSEDSFKV